MGGRDGVLPYDPGPGELIQPIDYTDPKIRRAQIPFQPVALAPLRAYADPMWDLLITAGNIVIIPVLGSPPSTRNP